MKLKPSCGWCQGYENFVENKSLATLIKCYSKLCQYVISSSDYQKQVEFANKCSNSSVESCKVKVNGMLKEGCEAELYSGGNLEEKPSTTSEARNNASLNPSKANPQTTVEEGRRGDLKLKLIIPSSGKKRRWYAANLQTQPKAPNANSEDTVSKKASLISGGLLKSESLLSQSEGSGSHIVIKSATDDPQDSILGRLGTVFMH